MAEPSREITLEELKNHDLRVIYEGNDTALKVALFHRVPFKGIALIADDATAEEEARVAESSTVKITTDHDTTSIDTFLRIFRALMAFGLKVRADELKGEFESERIWQEILWVNFGRNAQVDQRVKSSFIKTASGAETVTQYNEQANETNTEFMATIMLVRKLSLVRKMEFQLAWYRMTQGEDGTFPITWLSREEREYFGNVEESFLRLADDVLNKRFEFEPTTVILCEFPPFVRVQHTVTATDRATEPPWNFVLKAVRIGEDRRPERYERLYKLLVLWRHRNQDLNQTDTCIVYDPSGETIPGYIPAGQSAENWSILDSPLGTVMTAFYYGKGDNVGEEHHCNDTQLLPGLVEQWKARNLELEGAEQEHEEVGDRSRSGSIDSEGSKVTWSVTDDSPHSSPAGEARANGPDAMEGGDLGGG